MVLQFGVTQVKGLKSVLTLDLRLSILSICGWCLGYHSFSVI